MTAIITDKSSIAKQIAQALNMDIKAGNEGYFQGRGFILVWTSGKLLSLSSPDDCGKSRLVKDDLPFIPETLIPAIRKKKTKKGMVTDKAAAKELNIIQQAFDGCESIIAATDAGESGEWHFRSIYDYLQCKKPVKRLWINSLTAKAIREGFKNLGESSLYDNLYAAADCRAKADYLINLNASRAFSQATGLVNHPSGRLQTPMLAMLCKRFTEHRKFVSSRFFSHHITLEKEGRFLRFMLGGTMKNGRKAEKIHTCLKTFHTAQITKVEVQALTQSAPMPYNLSALQKEVNVLHGFPAAQTLEIARKLYEEKLISHPLTDSRSIPEDVFESLSKILRQTAAYCGMTDCLSAMEWENPNRRSVDDTDTFGHHALIPTGVYPGYLPKDEKTVYEMIVSRTLEAFAPDCWEEVMRVEAALDNLVLESKQSRIIVPGWRSIRKRESGEAKDNSVFQVFTEGETVRISGWNLLTRKTLPPPLYTEASLLEAMEDAGLGTADTRASVIEALVENACIERRGENLVPTEKGVVVYNCLKNMKIASMELAGGWERMLSDIACGKQDTETFMRAFKIFTRQVTEEILAPNPANQRRKR